jgi:type I restriction enzyme, S subunit
LEGLNASTIRLSLVKQDNAKLRIDAGYFSKHALVAVEAIAGILYEKLGDLASVFRKGIFDIKADTYSESEEGVPFIRIGDLKGGLINKDSTEWISFSAHKAEAKTRLTYGDIVLSKTAYPAACFVNIDECNVSQDTIAVRLSKGGRKHFNEAYIVAFLNSRFGMPLMEREFQGNVQQHLSLDDGKKLRIPKIDIQIQSRVDRLFHLSDTVRDSARVGIQNAERILLNALGLADWTPPEPLAYSAKSADVFAAARSMRNTLCRPKAQFETPSRECPVKQ